MKLATIAIVAISLVAAPNAADLKVPRQVHVSAIQLQATVTSAATHTTGATPMPSQSAATTPSAHLSPQTAITNAVAAAVVAGLAPFWYLAFPVTLPASFLLAGVLGLFRSDTRPVDRAQIVLVAIGIYVLGPPAFVLGLLVPTPLSAGAAADSNQVAAPAKAPQGSRAGRGVGGSGRTANVSMDAHRKPATHQTAKKGPAAADKKRAGVAGSGRNVTNKH